MLRQHVVFQQKYDFLYMLCTLKVFKGLDYFPMTDDTL